MEHLSLELADLRVGFDLSVEMETPWESFHQLILQGGWEFSLVVQSPGLSSSTLGVQVQPFTVALNLISHTA